MTDGDVAYNWRCFREHWENYVVAADLTEASTEKRSAIVLTCLGGEPYDTYLTRSLTLPAEDKMGILWVLLTRTVLVLPTRARDLSSENPPIGEIV